MPANSVWLGRSTPHELQEVVLLQAGEIHLLDEIETRALDLLAKALLAGSNMPQEPKSVGSRLLLRVSPVSSAATMTPARRGFGIWPGVGRSARGSREFVHRLVFRSVDETV